jgi:hypothetical protein
VGARLRWEARFRRRGREPRRLPPHLMAGVKSRGAKAPIGSIIDATLVQSASKSGRPTALGKRVAAMSLARPAAAAPSTPGVFSASSASAEEAVRMAGGAARRGGDEGGGCGTPYANCA